MPDVFIADEEKDKTSKQAPLHNKKEKTDVSSQERDRHMLSAFRHYPESVYFLNKDPEEKVVLILRRHAATNIGWLIVGLLMFFAPLFLSFFPILEGFPGRFQFIAVLGWYLLTAGFIFEKFLSWFFNVNIVTDRRVFDVDFVNLVYREMTDANLDQIQDSTVRMGSVIRTLFNYGDVVIQTAAELPKVTFEAVPNPDKVAKILRDLRAGQEKEKSKEK